MPITPNVSPDSAPVQGPSPTTLPTSLPAATLPADLPLLLPVTRAAALLGISRASAYRYVAAGDLPSRRLGGRVFVLTAGLRAMLEAA